MPSRKQRTQARLKRAVEQGRMSRAEAESRGLAKARQKPVSKLKKLNKDNPKFQPNKSTQESKLFSQDPGDKPKSNADHFLAILDTIPSEERGRYLSSFQEFKRLPKEQQDAYLKGFETFADSIVAPSFERGETRRLEDLEFQKEGIERQRNHLRATFEQMVGEIDFNEGRNIAKTNTSAASAIRSVTNMDFVRRSAGDGLTRRRTSLVNERAEIAIQDIKIGAGQSRNTLRLKKGQLEQDLESQLNRMEQLGKRDEFDAEQARKSSEAGLFFDLVGSDLAEKGLQFGEVLESDPTAALELDQAQDDFLSGGSDAQRRERQSRQDLLAEYEEFKKQFENDFGGFRAPGTNAQQTIDKVRDFRADVNQPLSEREENMVKSLKSAKEQFGSLLPLDFGPDSLRHIRLKFEKGEADRANSAAGIGNDGDFVGFESFDARGGIDPRGRPIETSEAFERRDASGTLRTKTNADRRADILRKKDFALDPKKQRSGRNTQLSRGSQVLSQKESIVIGDRKIPDPRDLQSRNITVAQRKTASQLRAEQRKKARGL